MKKIFLLCGLLLITSGCSMHHSAPVIRPELLISSSAEKISFPINDASSLSAIENWIANGDTPTGAEISCGASGKSCDAVKKLLNKRKIPFNENAGVADSAEGSVSLTYKRIIARDCSVNSFGCSTSINTVSMVTNREQFIKPTMSDVQDAASGVKALNKYEK